MLIRKHAPAASSSPSSASGCSPAETRPRQEVRRVRPPASPRAPWPLGPHDQSGKSGSASWPGQDVRPPKKKSKTLA